MTKPENKSKNTQEESKWNCKSPLKQARKERFQKWCSDEDAALAELKSFLSKGEVFSNLVAFCHAKDFSYSAMRYWLDENELEESKRTGDRWDIVNSARRVSADTKAEKAMEVLEKCKPSGDFLSNADVSLAKAKHDGYKWAAMCVDRSAYGDKTETTIKGDKENPVVMVNIKQF